MRAIWKGAVSFGLVSVPVKLYSATESHDISFRQVHAKDGGRIKYQRVCSIDGEEVPYADIAKGYETEDGQMVVLDDEDLAELPASSSREISVEKFVPREQIDPMMYERSYYLEPEKSGVKAYALLRDALREADRVAIVTVSLRTRMTPAVLRVKDDVIVLQTLMWPDEIRTPDFAGLRDVAEAKPQELTMARMLVETLAGDYDPDEFEDDYAGAVEALVQAKLEGGEVKRLPETKATGGEVVDLLAALQKSVAAARSARGEDAPEAEEATGTAGTRDGAGAAEEPEEEPARKPGRRTTAKKAASTKSGASETSGGKAPTRRAAAEKPAKKAPEKGAAKKTAAGKSTAKKTTSKRAAAKKSA